MHYKALSYGTTLKFTIWHGDLGMVTLVEIGKGFIHLY